MIRAGSAFVDITPPLGRAIQGASVDKVAKRIRDPLEANALYLERGEEKMLFISCDVVSLPTERVFPLYRAIGAHIDVDPEAIVIACTHTHSGPSVINTNYFKAVDEEFLDSLQPKLLGLAAEAVQSAQPARLAWGEGTSRIGYNRRVCWADGRHEMHGNALASDCTGLEGPEDPYHLALFAETLEGELIAIFHSASTHPTSFYGGEVWSADFPGESRAHLRQAFGEGLPVLFFTGAQGDLANICQASSKRYNGTPDQRCARCAHIITGETMRLWHEAPRHEDAELRLARESLSFSVRLPAPDRLAWATDILRRADAKEEVKSWDVMFAHGITKLQRTFGDRPTTQVELRVFRIGELGLVAQPSELYCQFALDIKRRSPAGHTVVAVQCSGHAGYCPTLYSPLTGGYSGEAIYSCRLEEGAGYKLVDAASRLLHQLWNEA